MGIKIVLDLSDLFKDSSIDKPSISIHSPSESNVMQNNSPHTAP